MTASTSDLALHAFRDVDFNWAVRLQDIWMAAVGDVPDIHRNARRQLLEQAERLKNHSDAGNPLGWFLTGSGGTGKTHLLNALQDQLVQQGFGFILVDMTDVRDFWETVAQGYITSLQSVLRDGRKQYAVLIDRFIRCLSVKASKAASLVGFLARRKSVRLKDDLDAVLNALARKHPSETLRYQDTIRALICLNSADFEIANMGSSWLQGLDIDEHLGKELKFRQKNQTPREIVRSLSWLMSLTGPTVLAFDQLDPIVHQVARQATIENKDEQNTAHWIIDQIGNGLGALRDTTTRTMVLVSCIEVTYEILTREAFSSNLARFHPPIRIVKPGPRELEALVRGRLSIAYAKHGFEPPYPTWPFGREAFESLENDTPRRILQLCDAHRQQCIEDGKVTELKSFRPIAEPITQNTTNLEDLDRRFAELRAQADIPALFDERKEDDGLAQLYQGAMECLKRQREPLPPGIAAIVEKEFGGGRTNRPLHVRLRLIMHNDNEREEHYCVRAIQKVNHAAFKTRLKAAMTQAGIDRTLTFRRLIIVRRAPLPGGTQTRELIADFQAKGGKFHNPGDEEIRTLFALNEFLQQNDSRLSAWLAARKPLDALQLAEVLTHGSLFATGAGPPSIPEPCSSNEKGPEYEKSGSAKAVSIATPGSRLPVGLPTPQKPVSTPTTTVPTKEPVSRTRDDSVLMVGHKIIGPDRYGEAVGPRLGALAKHTVVLAGAGSGKTVLLYRLVEEAALRGIPSIVVDCANDLSSFDEPKGSSPHWRPEDENLARRFCESSEMILWTPGKESGNPLTLQPLPDFDVVKDDPEELQDAVLMAIASLSEIVAKGTTEKAQKKRGILQSSLEFFARDYTSGTLGDYTEMLRDLPDGAGPGVSKEKALAVEMSDALRVQMTTNPLLNTTGAALDPALLFGDDEKRPATRISVISLLGLPTLDMQRTFLNQLAMILFSWIKKNPNPPGRPVRGLLVVDEARDFLPSQKASACKESMLRLGAQARKYGLGLVFATQHPKDIDHRLIGNSSTHFYGLNNSPASLATLQEQMKLKGGSGEDIARLKVGQFYFHSAGAAQMSPVKLKISDCLSNKRLLEEHEILAKARQSRLRIESRR
jgi:GTPase SAR1 family protein